MFFIMCHYGGYNAQFLFLKNPKTNAIERLIVLTLEPKIYTNMYQLYVDVC